VSKIKSALFSYSQRYGFLIEFNNMTLVFRNQQNNWAYVLVVVVISAIAAWGILSYTADTIQEINSLSAVDLP